MKLTEVEALGDLLEAETSLQLEIIQANMKVKLFNKQSKHINVHRALLKLKYLNGCR